MPNVWRLMAHHHHDEEQALEVINQAVQHGRIAIGWSEVGDLRQEPYNGPEDIVEAANRAPNLQGLPNLPRFGIQLWNFWGGGQDAHFTPASAFRTGATMRCSVGI